MLLKGYFFWGVGGRSGIVEACSYADVKSAVELDPYIIGNFVFDFKSYRNIGPKTFLARVH
jgi:hypothetical protein